MYSSQQIVKLHIFSVIQMDKLFKVLNMISFIDEEKIKEGTSIN